jgi:hypothetical protein
MKGPARRLLGSAVAVLLMTGSMHCLKKNAPTVTDPNLAEEESGTDNTPTSKLAPVDMELPKPMVKTRPHYSQLPNLEKPSSKPRTPFVAPLGSENVALGKRVYSSHCEPIIGKLKMITDGDKETADKSYIELEPGLQHVTIDLEDEYEMYAIAVWHYYREERVYFDVIVQVADDADFCENVGTLFNNDHDDSAGFGIGQDMHYVETHEGKLIDAKGIRRRYVRLYSNGNTSNDLNHYIEVEVYGRPVE